MGRRAVQPKKPFDAVNRPNETGTTVGPAKAIGILAAAEGASLVDADTENGPQWRMVPNGHSDMPAVS